MSTGSRTTEPPSLAFAAPAAFDAEIRHLLRRDRNQLSGREYRYLAALVAARAGARFLVFGVGNDSGLWLACNPGGRTVFLEDSTEWLARVRGVQPEIDARLVTYGTRRSEWQELLSADPAELQLDLPPDIAGERWDILFVDGPASCASDCPGRMKSLATAARLAHRIAGADVVVHDCDRELERAYCARFFAGDRLVAELDRMRHYRSAEPAA